MCNVDMHDEDQINVNNNHDDLQNDVNGRIARPQLFNNYFIQNVIQRRH